MEREREREREREKETACVSDCLSDGDADGETDDDFSVQPFGIAFLFSLNFKNCNISDYIYLVNSL